jgi:hypothetical protein
MGPMLFWIYLVSLIVLSSGLKWKYSWPHNQLRCRLFVYADAVEKGWVRTISGNTLTAMGATVESQTEFPDAAEFLWGLHGPYSGFPTVYTIYISHSQG